MPDLLLLAASGLAREVARSTLPGWCVVGVLDDDPEVHGTKLAGLPVLGGIDDAAGRSEHLVVCVGAGAGRRRIVERLEALGVTEDRFGTVLADAVRIPEGCTVGAGSILLKGAVLTADVSVGRHSVLMPNVTLTHDDILEDFVTIATGVALGGGVRVGEAAYLGMNVSVRQTVRIGAGATIGMGAAVLGDVPDGETWAGVPARRLAQR
ncbi:NeuD/PglB/VioB family sugar acetyltransferase [Rathayibacter sp. YIM 133350]|uniref:NeuD/PglB/VioB family sugar acetyltransferase n=1 Tax=Rathayibacter sp. YIM 133350 TaxID=3131992 RepID=UPI00307F8815